MTWYNHRRAKRAERRKRLPAVADWFLTFLVAIVIILVLNEYLFQFYVIPSGSMKNTLQVHDRISVNKLIYGPELIPGMWKTTGYGSPDYGDVITFKNPEYRSRGPLFDLAQRFLFMLTLSLVNIDRDTAGHLAVHFLIKRVVATGGDSIRIDPSDGSMQVEPAGTDRWLSEAVFDRELGVRFQTVRIFSAPDYKTVVGAAEADAYLRHGIRPGVEPAKALRSLPRFFDFKVFQEVRDRTGYEISPENHLVGGEWRRLALGWYVPPGSVFPMGDNRDDSRDGRYFGPVSARLILGKASFRFWPPWRIGGLRAR